MQDSYKVQEWFLIFPLMVLQDIGQILEIFFFPGSEISKIVYS